MKELQNLIDVAKGELLTATGEKQDALLTFIQCCVNAIYFGKRGGLIKEEPVEPQDGF